MNNRTWYGAVKSDMARYLFQHSKLYRDILWAWSNFKYRTWIRYANRHLLWVHIDQKFLDERLNWPIWPRY